MEASSAGLGGQTGEISVEGPKDWDMPQVTSRVAVPFVSGSMKRKATRGAILTPHLSHLKSAMLCA